VEGRYVCDVHVGVSLFVLLVISGLPSVGGGLS